MYLEGVDRKRTIWRTELVNVIADDAVIYIRNLILPKVR